MASHQFSDKCDRLSQAVKGSWDALEQLSGITGSDDLEIEKSLNENLTKLENFAKKRLGINGI